MIIALLKRQSIAATDRRVLQRWQHALASENTREVTVPRRTTRCQIRAVQQKSCGACIDVPPAGVRAVACHGRRQCLVTCGTLVCTRQHPKGTVDRCVAGVSERAYTALAGTTNHKEYHMMLSMRKIISAEALILGLGLFSSSATAGEIAVRWDIIHLAFTSPPTISAGGTASATTKNPSSLKIELTGAGTFKPGESGDVTGGGTWVTYSGCPRACVPTGSGMYQVTRLASWEFDNLQLLVLNDLIGQNAANGNVVFRIRYSDGSSGTLGIGCHGPGAHDGIVEGVIATKDFVTYWDAAAPAANVDANRTSFHIVLGKEEKED